MLAQPRSLPSPGRERAALTKAAAQAASLLDLSQAHLAEVLGLSAATISRMRSGAYLLDPARKEWELAALWVRLFRSLDSITGGQDEASRAWLHSPNTALEGVPAELIRQVTGLVRVVEYLDAARARV